MNKVKEKLKGYFNTGDKPTEREFAELIDSGLYLDENGNLGIGLETPQRALHIQGDGDISDDVIIDSRGDFENRSGALIFYRTNGNAEASLPVKAGHSLGLVSFRGLTGLNGQGEELFPRAVDIEAFAESDFESSQSVSLRFSTVSNNVRNERMRIDKDGNLVVGNSETDVQLFSGRQLVFTRRFEVNQGPLIGLSWRITTDYSETDPSNDDQQTLNFNLDTLSNLPEFFSREFEFARSGVARKKGGGDWVGLSDKRVKEKVAPLKEGLEKIKLMNPITFQYNGKGGIRKSAKTFCGFEAESLLEICPNMVSSLSRKLKESDTKETELLTVDTSALKFITINAIKELDNRLTQLESNAK